MSVDGVYHGWSWEVMMQPYMDASPFYNGVAQAIPNGLQSLPTQPQLSEVHSSLICPRTIGPSHVEHTIVCTSPVVDGVVTPGTFDWKNLFGRSNYFGNAGYFQDAVGGLKPDASGEPPATEPFVNAGSLGDSGSKFSTPHRYLARRTSEVSSGRTARSATAR